MPARQPQRPYHRPGLGLLLVCLLNTSYAFFRHSTTTTLGSSSIVSTDVVRQQQRAMCNVALAAGKKKQAWTPPENEFSRTIELDDVMRRPTLLKVQANEEERRKLAERFEFLNLHTLTANVSIARPHWGCLLAEGSLSASLDRHCVVTGELFPFEFTTTFSTYIKEVGGAVPLYGNSQQEEFGQGANDMEEDDFDDEVEAGTSIDVGEIVAQYLYLNMPPYPTLPGKSLDDIPDEVVFEWGSGDGEEGGEGGQGGGKAKKKKKERPGW